MADPLNDDDLYRRFLSKDITAYDELIKRYYDGLLRYLYGILADHYYAEDMTVEAFAAILAKKPGIGEGCFKAYLFRTGRNLAIRYAKKNRRADIFSFEELETAAISDSSPEREIIESEKKEILQNSLEQIDPKLKEALYLVYTNEMSYAEASEVMGISKKKLDHMLEKGKKLLKEQLLKKGMDHLS